MTEMEMVRAGMAAEINAKQAERERLEADHGQVWDTVQLQTDFQVVGFAAPVVVAIRRADGVKGSLFFQHSPRFYWGFQPA